MTPFTGRVALAQGDEQESIQLFQGGVEVESRGFWKDAAEQFLLSEVVSDMAAETWNRHVTSPTDDDEPFDPYEGDYLKGYEQYVGEFRDAGSKGQADFIRARIDQNNERRGELDKSGRFWARMLGEMTTPTNVALAFIPLAGTGGIAARGIKSAMSVAGAEAGAEFLLRRPFDPTRSNMETASTIGGGFILGGAFGGILGLPTSLRGNVSKAMELPSAKEAGKEIQTLNGGMAEDLATIAGTGNPKLVTPELEAARTTSAKGRPSSDDQRARLATSADTGDVPIYNDRGRGSASYTDREAMVSKARSVLMNMHSSEIFREGSALSRLMGDGKVEEAVELLEENIRANRNVADMFEADISQSAWTKINQDVTNTFNFQLMKRQRKAFDSFIRVNKAEMMKRYKKSGGNPNRALKQAGLRPLSDMGIERFETFADYEEFILRHELWHNAIVKGKEERFALQGPEGMRREVWLADENAVNEKAAQDYLNYRQERQKSRATNYRSTIGKLVDRKTNGRLSKFQGQAADFVEQRVANSPAGSIMRRSKTNEAADLMLQLIGDGASLSQAQLAGRQLPGSMMQRVKGWQGKSAVLHKKLERSFTKWLDMEDRGDLLYVNLTATMHPNQFSMYMEEVAKTQMRGTSHQNSAINEGVEHLNRFYRQFDTELDKAGLFRMQEADQIKGALNDIGLYLEQNRASMTKDQITFLEFRTKELTEALEFAESMPLDARRKNEYFSRFYNTAAIRKNREAFTKMIERAYRQNPKIIMKTQNENGTWSLKEVETNPYNARKRAEETVARILDEQNDAQFADMVPGQMRQRMVPLPNKAFLDVNVDGQMVDFIVTDPMAVTERYAKATGSKIEFAKMFRGEVWESAEDVFQRRMNEVGDAEAKAGTKPGELKKIKRDLSYLKTAVTNMIVTTPGRIDRHIASALKNFTHITTLGGSGLVSIPEAAVVAYRNGYARSFTEVARGFDPAFANYKKAARSTLMRAGAILDVVQGTVNTRFGEDVIDPVVQPRFLKHMDRVTNAMFIANLMGPLTVFNKELTGRLALDRSAGQIAAKFLNRSMRKPNKKEMELDDNLLERMGLNERQQRLIANQIDKHWDDIYDPETKTFSVDTAVWEDQAAARAYEAALINEIENTILVATLADKWKVMDGVIHIPSNRLTDRMFKGLPQDEGYWRLESPLISMPFLYMSFGMAATRKITAPMMRGDFGKAGRFMAASTSLAYLSLEIRALQTGQNREFISYGSKFSDALWYSSFVGVSMDYYDHAAEGLASVTYTAFGAEGELNLRTPNRSFFDTSGAGRTLAEKVTGPFGSKTMDLAEAAYHGNPERFGDIRRYIPLNQLWGLGPGMRALEKMAKEQVEALAKEEEERKKEAEEEEEKKKKEAEKEDKEKEKEEGQ